MSHHPLVSLRRPTATARQAWQVVLWPLRCILLIALAIGVGSGASGQIVITGPVPDHATITIDAAKVASYRIPQTIYGSFLEPIGNSTYNGLWAEILENPSLEENLWSASRVAQMILDEPALRTSSQLGLPLPWEPVAYDEGNRYEPHWGDAANSWRSLEVLGVPGKPTGIRQKIYLPVQRTRHYTGSLYAKHLSGPSQLTIAIHRRNESEALTTAHVNAGAAEWTRYDFTLDLPEHALSRLQPADFVVEVTEDARIDLDQITLNPADAEEGLDPDVVRMAKAMHTSVVRFGGNFTSGYHWRDGIGPADKRISMLNIAWGIPEYNTFGTDEFLRFCRLIGARPQIALNLGSGTPDEAADWMRFVDAHLPPGAGFTWELGNELWGNWNLGWPTLEQLPGRTREFSEAARKADASAKLIATGQDPDVFHDWNAAQLTNPPGTFDYLSTHFVVDVDHVQLHNATPDFIASATFALPIELGRRLEQMQAQIDQTPAFAGKAHLAFTEWLYVSRSDAAPNFSNMGGAIGAAGFFNMLMRHAPTVPISDMTGILEFAGIWKKRSQVYGVPAYYAFRMYANADATRPVEVKADGGSYAVNKGVSRLPEIADVPYLDVVAALNDSGDSLTLFCVNRHLTRDLETSLRISGFSAGGEAEIQTLNAASIYEKNDEDKPEHIVPTSTTERIGRGGFTHVFPHESVTVIRIRRKP